MYHKLKENTHNVLHMSKINRAQGKKYSHTQTRGMATPPHA